MLAGSILNDNFEKAFVYVGAPRVPTQTQSYTRKVNMFGCIYLSFSSLHSYVSETQLITYLHMFLCR